MQLPQGRTQGLAWWVQAPGHPGFLPTGPTGGLFGNYYWPTTGAWLPVASKQSALRSSQGHHSVSNNFQASDIDS